MSVPTESWTLALAAAMSAGALLVVRLAPIWPQRHQGCDAYYYLLAADIFRRERRLPIKFDRLFMLELREQWYPPGFTVLLSLFPQRFLERRYWLLNALFDLVPQSLIVASAAAAAGPGVALLAGLVYAFQAPLLGEYRSLNSRPLGMALFALVLLFGAWGVEGLWVWLAAASLALHALILSHKLSTQLLWFVLPATAIATFEPLWLVPLTAGYASACALTPRLFRRVIRQHGEIVAFWGENWPLLGAHEVRQSPLYGDGRSRQDYYRPEGPTAPRHAIRTFVHSNYWVVFVAAALAQWTSLDGTVRAMAVATVAIYVWALLTLCVPRLRCLGMWHQYLKFGYLPSLIVAAHGLAAGPGPILWPLAALCAILTLRYYFATARALYAMPATATGVADEALSPLLEVVAADPDARVMCTPLHLSDLVAFRTRKRVLWGTHGQGFPLMRRILPVITWPIERLARHHKLTHLLLDTRHALAAELKLDRPPLMRSGPFELHDLRSLWAATP